MKIKYAFFAFVCAAAVFLAGCGKELVCENGIADIKNANIKLSVPEDWSVTTGDDIYDEMYKALPEEYGSAKELKSSFEDNGERLLLDAQSPDGAVGVLLSEADKGDVSAREVLRTVHDTTIFDFRSLGFFTESSFEEYTWSGISGVMSDIKVSDSEGDPVALEEREFCFEHGDFIFSLKIHITGGYEQEADNIVISPNE